MVKRIALLLVLAGAAYLVWENRQVIKQLAGLDSNQMRIEGDWYQVRSNIKEFDRFTFNDKMIDRNGETYGEYSFTGNDQIQVVLGPASGTYTIAFPSADVMLWYQDVRGTPREAIHWER